MARDCAVGNSYNFERSIFCLFLAVHQVIQFGILLEYFLLMLLHSKQYHSGLQNFVAKFDLTNNEFGRPEPKVDNDKLKASIEPVW